MQHKLACILRANAAYAGVVYHVKFDIFALNCLSPNGTIPRESRLMPTQRKRSYEQIYSGASVFP